MLGLGAVGVWAIGTGPRSIAGSTTFLVASAGAYSITGVAVAFADRIAAATGAYAIAGQTTAFLDAMASVAGGYSLTGQAAAFKVGEPAAPGAYALTGQAASLNPREAAAPGSYALTGQASTDTVTQTSAGGSYAVSGRAALGTVTMVAAGTSYSLAVGPWVLTRTGDDDEFKLGGVGHYLEELQRQRDLQRISRKTPQPIRTQPWPAFSVAPPRSPPMGAPPVLDQLSLSAARAADLARRRRAALTVLLLSA
jgi:hypothetical protein